MNYPENYFAVGDYITTPFYENDFICQIVEFTNTFLATTPSASPVLALEADH